jgi:hypothetical protein
VESFKVGIRTAKITDRCCKIETFESYSFIANSGSIVQFLGYIGDKFGIKDLKEV